MLSKKSTSPLHLSLPSFLSDLTMSSIPGRFVLASEVLGINAFIPRDHRDDMREKLEAFGRRLDISQTGQKLLKGAIDSFITRMARQGAQPTDELKLFHDMIIPFVGAALATHEQNRFGVAQRIMQLVGMTTIPPHAQKTVHDGLKRVADELGNGVGEKMLKSMIDDVLVKMQAHSGESASETKGPMASKLAAHPLAGKVHDGMPAGAA